MVAFVYVMTLAYGLMYVFQYQIKSKSNIFDGFLLVVGGYVSGTSLIGAPLIVAVFMHRVAKEKLRNTLFVLWFVLVSIKLSVLGAVGVDFWWAAHLWLLPAATIGHIVGLKLHDHLMSSNAAQFKQVIGAVLIVVCLIGLFRLN
ncbi:MAG: sulfite exporter TauE/SafE family protein, partial [Ghiorsea sp.]|nr:sulfite exporter TauE/SafE family protein [Ghiorsea sp.]